MGKVRLVEYTPKDYDRWNAFIEQSNNGTLFHRLDFLDYHGEDVGRYASHLMWQKGDQIFAVLPLALYEEEGRKKAVSHNGASYGGIVTRQPLSYYRSCELIGQLTNYLNSKSIDEIRLTFPTRSVYRKYSETFFLCLQEKGFEIVNSDISSMVELTDEAEKIIESSVRNKYKKAVKNGLTCQLNASAEDFEVPFVKTFRKHNAQPTHSLAELHWLHARFPKRIYFDVAYYQGKPVAGICHFVINENTDSSFYTAHDPEYQHLHGLNYLIVESLKASFRLNYRYFDFGTSSFNGEGRGNIFRFKENFGAFGEFRHTFRWTREPHL